ncbi:MAG TPA: hypothetical protein VN452_00910 [Longilinea sp.]|nr:hypothetical protein [Longilinea sp.]
MGKYSSRMTQESLSNRDQQLHPVWRGVGFAFMILIPTIAIFGSIVLVDANSKNGWVAIPPEVINHGFGGPLLYVQIIVGVVIMLIMSVLFQLITFVLYRAFGPSRYGPLDVPPVTYNGPKKSR